MFLSLYIYKHTYLQTLVSDGSANPTRERKAVVARRLDETEGDRGNRTKEMVDHVEDHVAEKVAEEEDKETGTKGRGGETEMAKTSAQTTETSQIDNRGNSRLKDPTAIAPLLQKTTTATITMTTTTSMTTCTQTTSMATCTD